MLYFKGPGVMYCASCRQLSKKNNHFRYICSSSKFHTLGSYKNPSWPLHCLWAPSSALPSASHLLGTLPFMLGPESGFWSPVLRIFPYREQLSGILVKNSSTLWNRTVSSGSNFPARVEAPCEPTSCLFMILYPLSNSAENIVKLKKYLWTEWMSRLSYCTVGEELWKEYDQDRTGKW